ncbi:MAG: hypothetical protein R3C02_23240 [Planctomycetaceae bacterium]
MTDQAREEDWPSIASLVHRYGQPHGDCRTRSYCRGTQFVGQDRRIVGQTAVAWETTSHPFLVQRDFTSPDFARMRCDYRKTSAAISFNAVSISAAALPPSMSMT